jgi:ribosomal-protein-alanine N-acetyltransferase
MATMLYCESTNHGTDREEADMRPESYAAVSHATRDEVVSSNWRTSLPVLTGNQVRLRELRTSDAASLFAMLTTEEVTRFISPPPSTVEGFERFIAWTLQQRAAGAYVCYAVTLEGYDTAIGIFQVRQLNANFDTAEWGFAIGSPFWGTGVFAESAELVLDFAFNTLRVGRLEARVAVPNGRGKGALHKMGAVQDGLLKKSLRRNGDLLDQALYSILNEDWRLSRTSQPASSVRVH